MTKYFALLAACFISTTAHGSDSSGVMNVASILAREGGQQVITFRINNVGLIPLPAQGCMFNDRGVIDETTPGGKSMLNLATLARIHGTSVSVRVEGCVAFNPEEPTHTAPRIVRFAFGA